MKPTLIQLRALRRMNTTKFGAICGGILPEERLRESLDALIEMSVVIALHYAELFQFDALFEKLTSRFEREPKPHNAT